MRIRVTHKIDKLEREMARKPIRFVTLTETRMRKRAELGNKRAKAFAVESSGKHGRHYPNSFTVERLGIMLYEYGPDSAEPQGGMSFEFGSRKQEPHLDLERSAAIHGADALLRDVNKVVDRLFW